MIALNLTAENAEQALIKNYLEVNASEILAEKINNGVRIEKDGKVLINRKTLDSFMQYAQLEAQKLAEKGARYKCVGDQTVYGWAVHYFEENDVIGTLYNEDGTEYKPPKPVAKPSSKAKAAATAVIVEKPKPMTLFDLMDNGGAKIDASIVKTETEEAADDSKILEENKPADEPEVIASTVNKLENHGNLSNDVFAESPAILGPQELIPIGDNKFVDEDGVVYDKTPTAQTAVNSIPSVLQKIFGDTLIRR